MAFHVSWLRLILLIEVQKSYFVVGLRFWIYYLFAEKLFNVDEHVSNVQTPCSGHQPKIKVLGFRWIWGVLGIFRFSKRVIFDGSEFFARDCGIETRNGQKWMYQGLERSSFHLMMTSTISEKIYGPYG